MNVYKPFKVVYKCLILKLIPLATFAATRLENKKISIPSSSSREEA